MFSICTVIIKKLYDLFQTRWCNLVYRSFIFFNRAFSFFRILFLFHPVSFSHVKFRVVCILHHRCVCIQYAVHYTFSPCEQNKYTRCDRLGAKHRNATRYEAKLMSYNHTDITTARIDFGSYMQLNNRTKYNVLGN